MLTVPPPNSRAALLAEMTDLLDEALQCPGNEFIQRRTIDLLKVKAFSGRIPLVEWLQDYFSKRFQYQHTLTVPGSQPLVPTNPKAVAAPPAEGSQALSFDCPKCGRSFKSHPALCGHQKTHRNP